MIYKYSYQSIIFCLFPRLLRKESQMKPTVLSCSVQATLPIITSPCLLLNLCYQRRKANPSARSFLMLLIKKSLMSIIRTVSFQYSCMQMLHACKCCVHAYDVCVHIVFHSIHVIICINISSHTVYRSKT